MENACSQQKRRSVARSRFAHYLYSFIFQNASPFDKIAVAAAPKRLERVHGL